MSCDIPFSFYYTHLHRSAFTSSDASAWCLTPFSCARRQRLNVSSRSHSEKPRDPPKGFSLVMSPLMQSHCYLVATLKGQPVVHGRQLQSQRQTLFSKSRTFTAQGPCLHVWSGGAWTLACSKLAPRLVWGSVYLLARKAPTSCAWRFYVPVA